MSGDERGFSLVELLIVMAIILILAVLTIPAFSSFGRANALSASGQSLVDALNLARQTALTRSRSVQVRFYKLPEEVGGSESPSDYRAFQLFLVDGYSTNSLTRVRYLDKPIVISPVAKATSLWDDASCPERTPVAGDTTLSEAGLNYRFRQFSFRADGSTDLPLDRSWFLTLSAKTDGAKETGGLPANFITIQIDPQSGRTKTFQP